MPARAPARPRGAGSNRTLLLIGAAALAVVVFVIVRRRASSSPTLDTSGTPGPDLTGSASLGPSGGGANAPGQMPQTLLTQPDTLQQQVQQTDAGGTSNASTSAATASSQPNQPYYNPTLPVPTLPPYAPIPGTESHPQAGPASAPILNTPPGSNTHRPGFQLD